MLWRKQCCLCVKWGINLWGCTLSPLCTLVHLYPLPSLSQLCRWWWSFLMSKDQKGKKAANCRSLWFWTGLRLLCRVKRTLKSGRSWLSNHNQLFPKLIYMFKLMSVPFSSLFLFSSSFPNVCFSQGNLFVLSIHSLTWLQPLCRSKCACLSAVLSDH